MKKNILFIISIILLLGSTTIASLEGSGTGKYIDFDLMKLDVEINQINLEFNKNVTNIMIKENNSECFTVLKSDGEEVTLNVEFPDDQLEREKRREIYLIPKEELDLEETYKLIIENKLKAKNEETLDEDIEIEIRVGDSFNKEDTKETLNTKETIRKDIEDKEVNDNINKRYIVVSFIGIIISISAIFSFLKYKS